LDAVFRVLPSGTNYTHTLDISKEQQTQEENSNIIQGLTNTSSVINSNNLVSNKEDHINKTNTNVTNKTNTNVLFDIAPKPSNTTNTIDVKSWDSLMRQKLEQLLY
jgi:hypothetical protein